MPSDFALKAMNAAHRGLVTVTGGRIGYTAFGMPTIELTTVGRRSGQRRAVMLTAPIRRDESYVVVASRGGDDTHPAWFLNLRDNPEVEVSVRGKPAEKVTARIATTEEKAELWPEITGKYTNYRRYQERTERDIPLVFLGPLP